MKHFLLSSLLFCGTLSFAAVPQQYEVAIDDSLQHIVSFQMQYSLRHLSPEWGCAILMNKDQQIVALYDTDSLGMADLLLQQDVAVEVQHHEALPS